MNYDISKRISVKCKTDAAYRRAAEAAARFYERNKGYFSHRFSIDSIVECSGFKFSVAYTSSTITLYECPDYIASYYIHIDDEPEGILA